MSVNPTNESSSNAQNVELDKAIVEFLHAQEEGTRLDIPSLLEKHETVADELGEFINQQMQFGRMMSPVRKISEMARSGENILKEFGDYEIISEIGRGGMGVIYEAQQKGLKRRVALKMIRENRFLTNESLVRFQSEAEAAAALEHPNIVPVFRVGNVEGHPFFTMKLVRGGSLKQRLRSGPLSPKESAQLACQIATAVNYAHQRGILHRDLKPANILLDSSSNPQSSSSSDNDETHISGDTRGSKSSKSQSDFDGSKMNSSSDIKEGSLKPMISDFGLAKQLDPDLAHGLTLTGAVMGTPSFMSPEQAAGESAITTATDIYGVGAILFNMLTGKPPFEGSTPGEITRKVIEQNPVLSQEGSTVDQDLKTICLKCLEKSPSDRYASAAELADDLQRYVSGKPIMARRASTFEQCVKWARRNRTLAAILTAFATLLLVTLVGSVLFSFRLNSEVAKRGQTLKELQIQEAFTLEQRDRAFRRLFESKFAEVAARRSSGESGRRFGALEAAKEAVSQLPFIEVTDEEIFELRSETAGCLGNVDLTEVAKWDAPGYGNGVVAFSPDLTLFAYHRAADQPVNLYRTEDLARLGATDKADVVASIDVGPGVISGPFRCKFSDCGCYVLINCIGGNKLTQTVFALEKKRTVLQENGMYQATIGETSEMKLLATADSKTISIRNVAGMAEVISFPNPSPSSNNLMSFSPSGKWLARFGDGGAYVFEVATGEIVWHPSSDFAFDLDWHPHEPEIAITNKTEFQIWKLEKPRAKQTARFPQHNHNVFQIEYTSDGSVIAASTWSDNTRFWDIRSGEQLFSIAGSIGRFSDDGSKVGFRGAQTGIFQFEGKRLRKTISKADARHTGSQPIDLDVHPNGRWVAMGEKKGVRICDLKTGKHLVDVPGPGLVRFHPDGSCLFIGDRRVVKWPLNHELFGDGRSKLTIGPPQQVLRSSAYHGMDIDPEGKFLGTIRGEKTLVVNLKNTWRVVEMESSPRAHGVSISAGGRLVAVGNHGGSNARVYDGKTGKLLHTIETPSHARAKLNPDGSLLVVTSDSTADVYETENWERVYSLRDSDLEVAWPASFSNDGKYLLFTLRKPRGTLVVDAKSGENLIRIPGAAGTAPRDVHSYLTADQKLVSIREGNSLESWDLANIRKQLGEIGLDWKDAPVIAQVGANPKGVDDTENELVIDTLDEFLVPDTYTVPEVEVLWGSSRAAVFEKAMDAIRLAYTLPVVESTFAGWQKDYPDDPDLWQARGRFNRRLEKRECLDDWTKAIALADCDPMVYLLRGNESRWFNQRLFAVSDLRTYLNQASGSEMLRMYASQWLAWEVGLNVEGREQSSAELGQMLDRSKMFSGWVEEREGRIDGIADDKPTYLQVLAAKTLALAQLRNDDPQSAIKLLESIRPSKTKNFIKEAIGVELLLAMAYGAQGDEENAWKHYELGLKSKIRFQRMVASDAVDWSRLKLQSEKSLGMEAKPALKWTAIELATLATWDVGGVRVQFFADSKRFSDLESQTFEATEKPAENLFWSTTMTGGELALNLDVAEAGIYDAHIHLARARDYGKFEFSLNGKTVGSGFDGYLDSVVFGDRVVLEGVKLNKGANKLVLRNVGKSLLSSGFYAGIEFLEFKQK